MKLGKTAFDRQNVAAADQDNDIDGAGSFDPCCWFVVALEQNGSTTGTRCNVAPVCKVDHLSSDRMLFCLPTMTGMSVKSAYQPPWSAVFVVASQGLKYLVDICKEVIIMTNMLN